jgi:hypothetical protein
VDYEVSRTDVTSRPTAVVAATTWQEFPALWGQLLGEVWGCLRAGGITGGCRNVMLYLDDVPRSGVRWEIYGPHKEDPAKQWTEVYWLLSR